MDQISIIRQHLDPKLEPGVVWVSEEEDFELIGYVCLHIHPDTFRAAIKHNHALAPLITIIEALNPEPWEMLRLPAPYDVLHLHAAPDEVAEEVVRSLELYDERQPSQVCVYAPCLQPVTSTERGFSLCTAHADMVASWDAVTF